MPRDANAREGPTLLTETFRKQRPPGFIGDGSGVQSGVSSRESRGLGENADACLLGLLYRTEDTILFIIQEVKFIRAC